MLAQYRGVTVDEAFARRRRHARNNNALLTAVCHDVVDGRLALGAVTASATR